MAFYCPNYVTRSGLFFLPFCHCHGDLFRCDREFVEPGSCGVKDRIRHSRKRCIDHDFTDGFRDKWYINGNNACLRDGIFYGASVTNGYAQPDTCFMFAYDLENNKLLWRSADQTCNSMNFIVKNNVIICGYGFTSEDDYLYQLDLHTGEVLSRLTLKKQPDLLVYQDNTLYVHTYSYNYTIEIK